MTERPRSASPARCFVFAPLLLVAATVSCGGTAFAAETPPRTVRQLTIEGLKGAPSDWKVVDFSGADLGDELRPTADEGKIKVTLARPMQFIVKPREIETHSLARTGEQMTLPGGVIVPLVAQPDGSTEAKSAWFRLTLAASPMPAPWDPDAYEYITRLTFGLRRPPQISGSVSLEKPVVVKLGFEGLTAPEIPALTIDAPGLENEKTVELRFQPRTPAPKLLVRSTISDVNLELLALARLDVRPQQRSVLGFGLETVPVVVENVLAHGEPMAVERGTPIAVELQGGARLETPSPEFAAGSSSAVLRVRSAGIGAVTINANANGLMGRAAIEQRFPAGPLIAALLGGALGGYARRFLKGARRRRTVRHAAEGTIVGLVAFVAGVLGVGYLNLPPALVATEAGAFLVGALAGFVGVTVFEAMAKKQSGTAS